ncbi:MAG: DNA recombination protein RmuC, partial [bacterium]|nr:DNA recombination protein RmuC [bacterium]
MDLGLVATAASAFVLGAAIAWLASRGRTTGLEQALAQRERALDTLRGEHAATAQQLAEFRGRVEAEREAVERERANLRQLKQDLEKTFAALSAEALQRNNHSFLQLANETLAKINESAKGDLEKRQQAIGELVKPVRESLERVDAKIQELEAKRAGAYAGMSKQIEGLFEAQQRLQQEAGVLRSETSGLRQALRNPTVRGRWGEIQLRRVVELAGMLEHCDFEEQKTTESEERRDRPDLTVKLPGNKVIFVDAKAPLSAYLEAMEAPDEATRELRLRLHAKQLRDHVVALGRRAYARNDGRAPDFVFMFVPGEAFFSAALEQDPTLIEVGVDNHVFIASPTSLIAMLRAVAYSWDQRQLEENAREIGALGTELYDRLRRVGAFLAKLGDTLENTVKTYNETIGSLELRLLPSARKFYAKLGGSAGEEMKALTPVDVNVRELRASDFELESPD